MPSSSRALLVVEDDPDLHAELAEILERRGFEVIAARDGADALRRLSAAAVKPAAILLGLRMPVMDGVAFREAQLQDPTLSGIPVVVVSRDRRPANVARDGVEQDAALEWLLQDGADRR